MEVEFTREFLEYLQGITIDGKTFTTDFPNIYPNTYTKACSCTAINCNCLGNTGMKYEHAIQENKELREKNANLHKLVYDLLDQHKSVLDYNSFLLDKLIKIYLNNGI